MSCELVVYADFPRNPQERILLQTAPCELEVLLCAFQKDGSVEL